MSSRNLLVSTTRYLTRRPLPSAIRTRFVATSALSPQHRTLKRTTSPKFIPRAASMATATSSPMASKTTDTKVDPDQFFKTSGAQDSVWTKTLPYSELPTFGSLKNDVKTEVLIIGSGISGTSIAYELVRQGTQVTMIEARDVLSGETGRTSGHLSSELDEGYIEIGNKHGKDGAKMAAESHTWAAKRVGEVSKELGIECEYRMLRGVDISQFMKGTKEHDDDMKEIVDDMEAAKEAGLTAHYSEGHTIKGWDGKVDQRDAVIYENQATFHPTKYVCGLLEWLKKQPNFQAFTRTRAVSIREKGITVPLTSLHLGSNEAVVETADGHTITAGNVVEATAIPLQRLSLVAELAYMRTYCIAIRIPKGVVEDCLIYDSAEAYKYARLTECDDKDDYMIVGGCDHEVGREAGYDERYAELEDWTRKRFTQAGAVDFKWSGQIFEAVDFIGYIGRNSGSQHLYVVTGDCGNGLTHGVLAGKLISDMIRGVENPWEKLYDPRRRGGNIAKVLPDMITQDLQANAQYKRFLQSDIDDIEDLGLGKGGVLNSNSLSKPLAVYKDMDGTVHKLSALCPHMKGVVCWNDSEKSWDCPVHGSRFSKDGKQICGPSQVDMHPADHNELKTPGFMQ